MNHRLTKRSGKFASILDELREHLSALILLIKLVGQNPYKINELWKNYWPMVPVEYHDDVLYLELDDAMKAKVKDAKLYSAETRLVLKAKSMGG